MKTIFRDHVIIVARKQTLFPIATLELPFCPPFHRHYLLNRNSNLKAHLHYWLCRVQKNNTNGLFCFYSNFNAKFNSFVCRLKGIHSRPDTNRTGAEGLSQAAVMPGSNASSDVIKSASSFVMQNRQTSCSMWCPMYRARC